MATNVKGQTIAATFDRLLLRENVASAGNNMGPDDAAVNIEVQELDGDVTDSSALHISENRVGVNVAAPTSALDVSGDIVVSGSVDGEDLATHGTDIGLNNAHRVSDGSDHNFLDQSVVISSSPTLDGTNITGVPIGGGGTGQTTAQAAIDALANTAGASAGDILTESGGNAVWAAPSVFSGTLPVTDGGTGIATVAKGSVIAANTADTFTAITGGGAPEDGFILTYAGTPNTVSWAANAGSGGTPTLAGLTDATITDPGEDFSCLQMTGSPDHVLFIDNSVFSIGDGAATTNHPFTFACWIKFDNLSAILSICHKGITSGGTEEWEIGIDPAASGGAIAWHMFDASQTFPCGVGVKTVGWDGSDHYNEWLHIAVTTDGAESGDAEAGMKIYVNGVMYNDSSGLGASSGYTAGYNNTGLFNIGESCHGNGHADTFKMDEIAIWHTEVTPWAIKELYNKGRGGDLLEDTGAYSYSSEIEWYCKVNEIAGASVLEDELSINDGLITGATIEHDDEGLLQEEHLTFDEDNRVWINEAKSSLNDSFNTLRDVSLNSLGNPANYLYFNDLHTHTTAYDNDVGEVVVLPKADSSWGTGDESFTINFWYWMDTNDLICSTDYYWFTRKDYTDNTDARQQIMWNANNGFIKLSLQDSTGGTQTIRMNTTEGLADGEWRMVTFVIDRSVSTNGWGWAYSNGVDATLLNQGGGAGPGHDLSYTSTGFSPLGSFPAEFAPGAIGSEIFVANAAQKPHDYTWGGFPSHLLNCKMNNVTAWNRVLTPLEIVVMYNRGRSMRMTQDQGSYNAGANVKMWYPFTEGVGDIAHDASPYANHAQIWQHTTDAVWKGDPGATIPHDGSDPVDNIRYHGDIVPAYDFTNKKWTTDTLGNLLAKEPERQAILDALTLTELATDEHVLTKDTSTGKATWKAAAGGGGGGGDLSFDGTTFGADQVVGSNDNYDLGFETNATTRMTILKTGEVGVKVVPTAGNDFQIKGYADTECILQMTTTTTDIRALALSNSTGRLDLHGAKVSITNTGKVGIGTMSPDYDLEVDGDIRASGDIITGDIHLNNEHKGPNEVDGTMGSWTMQEGTDDLFLINRNSGKKYKFMLKEV